MIKKIVNYKVSQLDHSDNRFAPATQVSVIQPTQMSETIKRPDVLLGNTYKIKPPVSDHAMYITINDMILNEDTDFEERRPYEVFINSKNMEHFQWVIAITRLISAVFRKGGEVSFLIEELKSVHDPKGGYYKKGGIFMPSLVAEIGDVIERHLKKINYIKGEEMAPHTKAILAEKRAQFEAMEAVKSNISSEYPDSAVLCNDCHTKAVIRVENCAVCLCCGSSRC